MGPNNNILVGLGSILLGGVILFLIRDFPGLDDGHPGPALFPGILAGLFIFFGLVLSIQGLKTRRHTIAKPSPDLEQALGSTPPRVTDVDVPLEGKIYSFQGILNALCAIVAILFYIFFVETLGFLITGFLLLTFLMIKLGVSIWKSGIISILSAVGVYMLFAKILRVPLPWGLLGW